MAQLQAVAWLLVSSVVTSFGASPFFAMDTGARGGPETVVPWLKELGYDGLGGSPSGAGAMAGALEGAGMQLFNVYLTLRFEEGQPGLSEALRHTIDEVQGHHAALWIAITPPTAATSDAEATVLAGLREIADYAAPRQVRLALYPHTGSFLEHVEDALRLATKLDRPEVGATFNLCHWLKVEGARDPEPVLRAALPRLMFVTINGADAGDTRKMNWDRLIQPLDAGSYDVRGFLQMLEKVGYHGPIGLQGFAIPGDQKQNLTRSMTAWRSFQRP